MLITTPLSTIQETSLKHLIMQQEPLQQSQKPFNLRHPQPGSICLPVERISFVSFWTEIAGRISWIRPINAFKSIQHGPKQELVPDHWCPPPMTTPPMTTDRNCVSCIDRKCIDLNYTLTQNSDWPNTLHLSFFVWGLLSHKRESPRIPLGWEGSIGEPERSWP